LKLRYLEGIAAAALGAAAAFYLHTALHLPVPRYGAATTPGLMPTIYASLMLFLCAMLFGKAVLVRGGKGEERVVFSAAGLAKIGVALAALLAYALLLDTLGFLLSSFLFLAGVTPLFGRVPWWMWLAAPAFLAVSSHLVFVTLLKLRLPQGFLPLPF
jgi:putative tricarboxylic transport membrane protein